MRLFILTALAAATASAQCYQFAGGGVTLKINITSINTQLGPTNVAGGASTTYAFSSDNSFSAGSSTLTSQSLFDGTATVQYLMLGSTSTTTFQIVVPSNIPKSGTGNHTWQAVMIGHGDLIPSHVFPTSFPSISAWDITSSIVDTEGTSKVTYPLAATGFCSSAGSGGSTVNGKSLGDTSDQPGGCGCGEPIDLASGNLFERVVDYQTAGPNSLSLIRYYNSFANPQSLASIWGSNWRSNFDRFLRISPTSVIAERADGRELTFALNGTSWTTDADVDVTLTNSGSTWTLVDLDDTVEKYSVVSSTQGYLQSIQARNGYTQTLSYNSTHQLTSVADSNGRSLIFNYQNSQLFSVTTPDGLTITPGILANRLLGVQYSTSPVTEQDYAYENAAFPNALTALSDERGVRYAMWTFDSKGRAITSQHAGGADLTTIAYNDTDGSRTVTGPLGAQETFKFATIQGVQKVIEDDRLATSTTPAGIMKYTYDGNGYIASITDWNGNVANFTSDSHGRLTSIVRAAGTAQARTTSVSYHPSFHLPLRIVTAGLTTSFTYDDHGEVLTRTQTDTSSNTIDPYVGQSRTWTYTWSNSLLTSVTGPRTDVNALTRFDYDSTGALTSVTNALGQVVKITQHSPGGSPLTVVNENGVTSTLLYDGRQRLLSRTLVTSGGSFTTKFTYDGVGDVLSFTEADGSSVSRSYDNARRLTSITDLFAQKITYALDAAGNRTQTVIGDSSGVSRASRSDAFDALSREIKFTGGGGQVTNDGYDANGNLTRITDPLSHTSQRGFDAFDQLVKITNALSGSISISYDAHARPTSVTDANNNVTQYVYDGFGDVIQESSAARGTLVYQYNADGNLIQKTDARGVITNYSYDALDRLVSRTYPHNPAENVTRTYDEGTFGIGNLTTIQDAAGTLSRTYDERGNLLTETRITGTAALQSAFTYDAASRVVAITYPSGWSVTFTRDKMGRVTDIAATKPGGGSTKIVSGVAYQPFGPVNGLTYGNGIAETRAFDQDYRLTNIASSAEKLTYGYDAADNVLSIGDGLSAANNQTFGYDAVNRIAAASGPYGSSAYTYDPNGNRTSDSSAASTDGLGDVATFTYNQAGRLATVATSSKQLTEYSYDAFGFRVVKIGAVTGTTLYVYDRNGRLLEETDGQGHAQVDYVYLGNRPVATMQADGSVHWLHTERLGAPAVASDSNKAVVWSTTYPPFGSISTPVTIVQNLRLPGQEFDLDTGLHQNLFRNYVPAIGRYTQADPTGVHTGTNLYAYVAGNPLRWIDPSGLCSITANADVTTIEGRSEELQIPTSEWDSLSTDSQQQVELDVDAYTPYSTSLAANTLHALFVSFDAEGRALYDYIARLRGAPTLEEIETQMLNDQSDLDRVGIRG
jgi:RHS repeat-associated protein